ncbi:hypothetical protein M378DRAFT_19473 [Amanita muscaria Koide BX008]|uniref:Uncharacterized protein n=1 Tax=Amanita muscaria (strain Koide BX008) TaxID=946122 RepID=A0A0C2WB89_AMAMK|nr:hypothetical protein M378DRAFT_19473 [Amanita muscaria Koide BX008]
MKGHDLDYVKACVQIMEHGNALHGIDNPQPAMANTHFMRPRHVELDHVPYLLVPGNVKRFENETKRNPWQQICLKCGLSHFTNEHTCKIVYVDQDLQKSTPDNRFHPRRTEQFQGPEQPIRAQYYSDVVYCEPETGERIVGNRHCRMDPRLNVTTTYATIAENGRMMSTAQYREQRPEPPIPSFLRSVSTRSTTQRQADQVRITRPRGTSVQAEPMRQASYEAIDRTAPRGSTTTPTPGPSRQQNNENTPPRARRGGRGARTRAQYVLNTLPIRSTRGTRRQINPHHHHLTEQQYVPNGQESD